MALSSFQIQTLYRNVLQRDAVPVELATWESASRSGAVTDAQIYAAIIGSEEAQNGVHAVMRIYQAAFGRIADKGGLDQQTDSLVRGGFTVKNIAAGFVVSQEFANRFNNGVLVADNAAAVSEGFLQALYQNVLGRAGSAPEIAIWKAEVARGQAFKTASDVLHGFSQSPEFIQKTASSISSFLTLAGQGQATYSGPLIESAVPSTFTLTSGTDNYLGTAGNNTINAVFDANSFANTTLNATDTINGGAGTDLLSVKTTSIDSTIAWPTVTNVEQISITPQTSNGAFTANLSAVTGLQTLTLDFAGFSSNRMLVTLPDGLTTIDAKGGLSGNKIVATSTNADTANDVFTWSINNLNSNLHLRQSTGSALEKIIINASGTNSVSFAQSTAVFPRLDIEVPVKSSNITVLGDGLLTFNMSGTPTGGPAILDASNFKGTGTFLLDPGTIFFIGGPGNDTIYTADAARLTLGQGSDKIYIDKIAYQTITDFNILEDKLFFRKTPLSNASAIVNTNNFDSIQDWFSAGIAAYNQSVSPPSVGYVVVYGWRSDVYLFFDYKDTTYSEDFNFGLDSMVHLQGVNPSAANLTAIQSAISFY